VERYREQNEIMIDDFEKLIEKLQKKIEYEEENTYSKKVIYEYRNPSNFGILDSPDAYAKIKGPCGDTVKISLKIEKGKIKKAYFWTDGCGATIACGSMLTKMIIGRPIKEVIGFTSFNLVKALDGLPNEHLHCSVLAVNSLKKAIKKYENKN
jgi:nitrogen fixation NifU-like protein